jgi:hypothetical protein
MSRKTWPSHLARYVIKILSKMMAQRLLQALDLILGPLTDSIKAVKESYFWLMACGQVINWDRSRTSLLEGTTKYV